MEASEAKTPDHEHYRELKAFIDANRHIPGPLIQVLHRAQQIFGYLPEEVQRFVGREMNIPISKIFGVATFYNFFRIEPIGEHIVNVCLGTACHVKGSSRIVQALETELDIKCGSTTRDRFFTLSTARCFGACGLAPVMLIDEDVFGRMNPQKAIQIVRDFKKENQKN